jgi:hypothetical protein
MNHAMVSRSSAKEGIRSRLRLLPGEIARHNDRGEPE